MNNEQRVNEEGGEEPENPFKLKFESLPDMHQRTADQDMREMVSKFINASTAANKEDPPKSLQQLQTQLAAMRLAREDGDQSAIAQENRTLQELLSRLIARKEDQDRRKKLEQDLSEARDKEQELKDTLDSVTKELEEMRAKHKGDHCLSEEDFDWIASKMEGLSSQAESLHKDYKISQRQVGRLVKQVAATGASPEREPAF
ncbi:hypothetical protein HII31_01888 [Pseudocercospora fuligena]|uniref:Uncharacterized protein n=1 Tax=Pseudocercospora fuligena TaxID=685502 RepID=A0A8H6RSM9_9PEZI|nr:hypothetical protein HII31_01888 [Pseudocercospora fuligena]